MSVRIGPPTNPRAAADLIALLTRDPAPRSRARAPAPTPVRGPGGAAPNYSDPAFRRAMLLYMRSRMPRYSGPPRAKPVWTARGWKLS